MGKQWYKTIADIFADILSTRPGDKLFFQLTNRSVNGGSSLEDYLSQINFENSPAKLTTGNGFTGVVEIDGTPFFDPSNVGDKARVPSSVPVRAPLSCENYLPYPVAEELALTYETEITELWNPKYKKALPGGAKSLTSVTPEEGAQLGSLIHENNDLVFKIDQEPYKGNSENKISIENRLHQQEDSDDTRDSVPDSIGDLNLGEIPFTSGEKFRVEKTLEAWLMEMIDSDHRGLREVFGPKDELAWFTNYVPYGISGTNMDGLAFHRRNSKRYKISVIELKRNKATSSAVKQVVSYARWVTGYLAGGNEQIVQPILIANNFSADAIDIAKAQIGPRPPMLVSYRIEEESCILEVEAGSLNL